MKGDIVWEIDGFHPIQKVGKIINDAGDGNIWFVGLFGKTKGLIDIPLIPTIRYDLPNNDELRVKIAIG